ncbi:uncharacterized protein EHS24_005373 [Apiotrichum porosum]|uniref:Spherulation-specific family 4 n=1 Tax=Apiotrichum porosum TaxID=105984 RepID=A0A427XD60_9TREE|nr:uncharacterized protein EHS24_005373 [Apiotrichum porosum]RSH76795.1 hypothetical protein EHS24_005373 [Apiotrichum porosum]
MTTYVSASSVSNLAPAPPALVVPVYMYPAEGAWSPLFAAARAHPNLTLMCIINPGNGPGPERLPDASYKSALEQLCALPNVQPLGYVHCTYGKRDVEDIKADIDKYAAWETQSGQAFRLDGVFVDEAPSDPALEPS